jgi:hypothetical protein
MTPLHGLCQTLPNKPHRHQKPLRFVSCVVRHPCSCCCLTMLVAVITSIAGMRTLIRNSSDGVPFKIGVDYPNFELIAKNSDGAQPRPIPARTRPPSQPGLASCCTLFATAHTTRSTFILPTSTLFGHGGELVGAPRRNRRRIWSSA